MAKLTHAPLRAKPARKSLLLASALALTPLLAFAVPALASTLAASGTVTQINLVSDGSIAAAHTDPNLVNPWGISYSPTGEFWVSNNGTGTSTLYDTAGIPSTLVVAIPPPSGKHGISTPTGQVFNGTTGYSVTSAGKSGASVFIFATEDGTVSGWAPGVDQTHAILAIDQSKAQANYKGMALVPISGGTELMLANFHSGKVEIYDSTFKPVSQFRDTGAKGVSPIPANYAPFNVAVVGSKIYVAYAKADKQHHDDIPGAHTGFIDEVTSNGTLVKRLVSHGLLNAPWGIAAAPSSWGKLAGALLVGNFGDGRITAYDPASGKSLGQLSTAKNTPLSIDGLWGIIPGNGGTGGSAADIYFAAGPGSEAHGLFGSLSFKP